MKYFIAVTFLLLSLSSFAQTKIYPYRKGKLWGYCDENKKIIVPPTYSITYPYSDGLGLVINYDSVQKRYLYGFVDVKGKVIVPIQFISATYFTNERSIVRNATGKYGIIDTKGKIIVQPVYKKMKFLPGSALFCITNDQNKTGLFDLNGKKLVDFKYDDIDDATINWHAILNTDNAGKQYCTWVDRNTGKELPLKLAGAEEFSEGLAAARDMNTGLLGYINTKGEWVISPKYYMGKPFSGGIALITNSQTNSKQMYINAKGDTLFNKNGYSTGESFKEGVAVVDYKFMTTDGSPLLPQYNFCYDFRGGLAQVRVIPAQKSYDTPDWMLIDKTGKIISQTPYSGGGFGYSDSGYILRQEGWKYGLIDRDGKTLFPPKYNRLNYRNGLLCSTYQDQNYNDIIIGYVTEKGVECWDE